jgi:hypothetical protein
MILAMILPLGLVLGGMHVTPTMSSLKQGCPLSSYLFVFSMNELSLALQDALQANHLTFILHGPNCPHIHSLMFADDLIICGKANV